MEHPMLEQIQQDLNDWLAKLKQIPKDSSKDFSLTLHPRCSRGYGLHISTFNLEAERWPRGLYVIDGHGDNFIVCAGPTFSSLYPPSDAATKRLCSFGLGFSIMRSEKANKFELFRPGLAQTLSCPEDAATIFGGFDSHLWLNECEAECWSGAPITEKRINEFYTAQTNRWLIHQAVSQPTDLFAFVQSIQSRTDGPFEIQSFDPLSGYPGNHRIYKTVKQSLEKLLQEQDLSLDDLPGLCYDEGVQLSSRLREIVLRGLPQWLRDTIELDCEVYGNVIREAAES
jgi:hypothetical protein